MSGRSVFITGASRGIGKAIAISFARGGASLIAIGARTAEHLGPVAQELKEAARRAGRDADALRVICVGLDVSRPESVAAAAEVVRRELAAAGRGVLDVVVQNAGVSGEFEGITEADPDGWWKVYEVNVRGQFLVARYFLPLLLLAKGEEGEGGSGGGLKTFVTVASVGAHLHTPGASQYQPGKLTNLRFAECVDGEFGGRGVSAWCVHPGNVVTDMTEGQDADRMRDSKCRLSPPFLCLAVCCYPGTRVLISYQYQSSSILLRSVRTPLST